MAIENHAWNGNDQSERRVIQRDRNAVSELDRVRAGGGLRAEDLDHAHDRPEQTQQWRHGGDGAQRGEKTLLLVADDSADFLDGFFHHRPRAFNVRQPRGEHSSERPLHRRSRQNLLHNPVAMPVLV